MGPGDETPPTVSIAAPAAGAEVKGSVQLRTNASDETGLAGVLFRVDGANLGPEALAPPFEANWDTTAFSDGMHSVSAVARDEADHTATAAPVTVTVDNTPPPAAVTSPANGATVGGIVGLQADASDAIRLASAQFLVDGVDFGAPLSSAPFGLPWDTAQAAAGQHTIQVRAQDGAGNSTTSALVTVTVDNSAPTMSIDSPGPGATLSGFVAILSTTNDDGPIAGVQYFLDGAPLGAEVALAPFSLSWDTEQASDGPHTLTAVVRDVAGNTGSASAVDVTVDNGRPTVAITSPADQATVSGAVIAAATAADSTGVVDVKFFIDGVLRLTDDAPPYEFPWDTVTGADGAHTVTAEATDATGINGSAQITVTVDNNPPAVAIQSPADQASVRGAVPVAASATDAVGVEDVRFFVDGLLRATDDAAPHGFDWNSTAESDGPHILSAEARDAHGAMASTQITVQVDNTAPSVFLAAPSGPSTLSGPFLATAAAADAMGVAHVEFFVDGVLRATDDTEPYEYTWDTAAETDGPHTLRAEATDEAGNTASAQFAATLDNSAPSVSITAPASQSMLSGSVLATVTATDTVGVEAVRFFIDGILRATDDTAPYSFNWDTAADQDGPHALGAEARDGSGGVVSTQVAVTIDNNAPTVAITTPAAATVLGLVAVAADAADAVGVVGVEFSIDGVPAADDTTPPFGFNWDTTEIANGPYTVSARARDAAGHTAMTQVALIVENPPPPPGTSVVRLSAGRSSGSYTDTLGRFWAADQYFVGGGLISAPAVSGTPDSGLYRLARTSPYTDFGWNIPVTNGLYAVTLKFAETTYSSVGQRTFDVRINGTTVLDDFDIVAAAGAWRTAHDRSFVIEAANGLIDIDILRGNRFGIVSAIEVVPSGPPAPDETPPIRSSGAPSGALPSGVVQATLSLGTNEDATCRYSSTPETSFAAMTGVFAVTGGKSHQRVVNGLANGEAYVYYIRCQDPAGNANGDDYSIGFSVNAPPPPSISIATPTQNATVSGQTPITATVTGQNIDGVSFFVGGVQVGLEDTTPPFSFAWDTTVHADGVAALTARLRYHGSPEQTLDSAVRNVMIDNSGPPPGATVIRLNAGSGNAYTDTDGVVWEADRHFAGGELISAPTTRGTTDPQLYRRTRSSFYTDFGWDIPVGDGQYAVTLKFAETTYSSVGQRIFDVVVNGTTVLNDFDIVREAGAWRTAHDETFEVDVTTGRMDIDIVRVNRFGMVSAIEIVPAGQPPPDTVPPVRSNSSPSGVLPAGSTQATLSLATDEDASCRYAATPGTDYAAMTSMFATTGGRTHQTPATGLSDGEAYAYYVRCADGLGNVNEGDLAINFSVGVPSPASISITSPAGGATVSGGVAISAAVTGPGLHGVTFFVDGTQIGVEDTSAPFSLNWDTTTHANNTATLTARLRHGSPPESLDSAAVNVTVDNAGPPPGTSVIRLNAGPNVAYTDKQGRLWQADQHFTGGGIISAPTVSGTEDPQLYRVARAGVYTDFGWNIPVSNGQYTVTLKFAETSYQNVGQRIFDVAINGTNVLNDFDIVREAGSWRVAHDETFEINVTGGIIDIDVLRVNRFGIVSAIEIVPSGAQ